MTRNSSIKVEVSRSGCYWSDIGKTRAANCVCESFIVLQPQRPERHRCGDRTTLKMERPAWLTHCTWNTSPGFQCQSAGADRIHPCSSGYIQGAWRRRAILVTLVFTGFIET